MRKQELIDFLEPFSGDIKIVVRGANKGLVAPIDYKLSYEPFNEEHESLVVITIASAVAVDTGVSG